MAARKPLVYDTDGHIEQIQPGDTLAAPVAGGTVIQATNGEAGAITLGQVVYISAADTVKYARANAVATASPVGFVADASIGAAGVGGIQIDGLLVSADWTAVVGATTLTAGTEYFLSPDVAGEMVSTPPAPTDTGEFSVSLGRAFSTTDFRIEIHPFIRL